MAVASIQEDETSFTGPTFVPPVYSERYRVALEIAARINAKKVVDMGCAECKLLALMRRQPQVEELIGVDIDMELLQRRENAIKPLTSDWLIKRERPLCIRLMQGSIAEPDQRVVNCDLLTCIEVIEHLESDVLEKVPHTLFGIVRPKVVLLTTPNSDFNVLFPNLRGFRHPDHKFEWSRTQFQSWCFDIAEKYLYFVEFSGVGSPPPGQEKLGHCSQIATFTSLASPSKSDAEQLQLGTPYTVVAEVVYPYLDSPPSPKEKLCNDIIYYLNSLAWHKMREGDSDEESTEHKEDKADDGGGGGRSDKGDRKDRSDVEEKEIETRCRHCGGRVDLWTVHVALKEVLKFPQLQQQTTSVDDIRSALKLSTAVSLDDTNTCAVFQEEDKMSDLSASSSEPEDFVEQAVVGNVEVPSAVGGSVKEENAEIWE